MPPVVTINGLAVTPKSFSGSTIVGTLATAVTGDYTVKITNRKRQSIAYTVAEPPQKADSRNTKNKSEGVNVAACYMHRDAAIEDSLVRAEQPSQAENKGCNPIALPGSCSRHQQHTVIRRRARTKYDLGEKIFCLSPF